MKKANKKLNAAIIVIGNEILSGRTQDVNVIKNGDVVYTSGIDGTIDEGIPIGRVFLEDDSKFVKFFVDFTQLKFVMINN